MKGRVWRHVGPHLDRAVQPEGVVLALREVAVAQLVAAEGAVLEPTGRLSDQSEGKPHLHFGMQGCCGRCWRTNQKAVRCFPDHRCGTSRCMKRQACSDAHPCTPVDDRRRARASWSPLSPLTWPLAPNDTALGGPVWLLFESPAMGSAGNVWLYQNLIGRGTPSRQVVTFACA